MKSLEDIFYDWLLDYMAPEYADQLSAQLAHETREWSRYQFIAGFLIGALLTVIILTLR
jgi:hypothetical protein